MKKLFRYLMLFVFLWGITSQIEAKDKHFIIQGIEYRLSQIVGEQYCSVDNLRPKQMKDSTCLVIPAYVSYKGKSYPVTHCYLGVNKSEEKVVKNIRYLTIPKTLPVDAHGFTTFTSLESVYFEDGVEEIGDFAFYQSPSLNFISLPESIKKIGSYAFYGCSGLETVYFKGKVPNISNSGKIPTTCIIKVPTEYLQVYKDAFGKNYKYIYALNSATVSKNRLLDSKLLL